MPRLLALMSLLSWVASTALAEDAVPYENALPLITKYCLDCHGGERPEGELSLDGFTDVDALRATRDVGDTVIQMLRGELMPPEDAQQPTTDERRAMIGVIEALLFPTDCQGEQDPGRVTIRRLNRREYNNTVRDLLGVDLRPADDFPADDVGEHFDNIGDVLSLTPLLLEKYLSAAEQLATAAIVPPERLRPLRHRRKGDRLTVTAAAIGKPHVDEYGVFSFFAEGGVRGQFDIASAGEYEIRLHAAADQAGPQLAQAELKVDGQSVGVIEVKAVRGNSATYPLKTKLPQGRVTISADFINDYYQPEETDPQLRGDRNLMIHWLEVVGPPPQTTLPPSHHRLVVACPDKEHSRQEAALRCLRPLLRRAFRRPVSDAEVSPFVKLIELAAERGESFERGLQIAVTAVLVSPQFLFRVERDPDPNDPDERHSLSQYELATRLSYFLWSSMPDERLFKLADEGQLDRDEVLTQEVRRMLQDPRARQLAENFGGQWLNLRNLDQATPDPTQFHFPAELREDMKRETLLFFASVMRENRSILDFVQGDYTYLNERLAQHYGVAEVHGDDFQRQQQPSQRQAGVLAHGSVLTLTSTPTRTSPVKRGKWILENLLGTPPPDPPAVVPDLEETQQTLPNATLREQLELHRSQATCAVCHRQMDALGFGLENFDAIGRWRELDRGQSVDARGELPGGVRFSGPVELAQVLVGRPRQVSRCLAEKMLVYALGRGLRHFDRCTIDKIVERLEQKEYRFHELVQGIVLSQPFRQRRGEQPKP